MVLGATGAGDADAAVEGVPKEEGRSEAMGGAAEA